MLRAKNINWLKWAAIFAAVVALLSLVKRFLRPLQDWLSSIFAKDQAKKIIAESQTTNPESGVRYSHVQGVVKAVIAEITSPFYVDTDEKRIVSELNTLMNPNEAIYASTFYQQQTGNSLKADLIKQLAADWRPNPGRRYKDLKKFIQDNLK